MAGIAQRRNIGAFIGAKKAIKPTNAGAGAINGTGFDRTGEQSCTFIVMCGDASGSPSAQTVDCKLQDSADNSTFADVSGATADQLTGDDESAYKDFNLSGLRQYVRLVVTVALTGGSTPAIPVAASLILGGSDNLPLA